MQTPLEFLQSIYSDDEVPLPVRMRAAIEALPFVHPKLAVTESRVSFASHMEALSRSRGRPNVIDAKPIFQNVEVSGD